MSQFVDRLMFFRKYAGSFSDGHGVVTNESRAWEDQYRNRWQSDKIVRSTHGVNCTGSCSWKIYVKNGLVTWETQQTDYPRTRPDLPNHEPRGCPRGASYSWYIYSSNRIRHPLVRGRLLGMWREARATLSPVDAWASIVEDRGRARSYKSVRGMGGFVRAKWSEVNELIGAANVYTVRKYGPDRVAGFSPIPAMSMVSYAAGTRYLSLIGGTCISFYDWYCDLPPSSPQVWGEQTDVPESADWYNSMFLIVWGSNIPQTRTPDAPFYTQVRYKGARTVVIQPDYNDCSKFADLWLHPQQGTDAALAMAMGHVILKEFHVEQSSPYFSEYCRRFTDLPMLVRLEKRGGAYVPGQFVRAADFADDLGEAHLPQWKTVAFDEVGGGIVVPRGSIGFRWDEAGRWNLEERAAGGADVRLALSTAGRSDEVLPVLFPYFGGRAREYFKSTDHPATLTRNVPARRVALAREEALVTTVFDLLAAHYGVDRGLGGETAASYDDDVPYTPAWQEPITGVDRKHAIAVARQFARNAEKTEGKSMVILGAGLNHWYHMDMAYRAIINMLMLCGCIGRSGGGWAHYVGQEKLRPQAGWLPLAFASDWHRPPRQVNGTSYFYAHSCQWKYELLEVSELLSPLADPARWTGHLIDYNVRAERMGWLPSSPQLATNPLELCRAAGEAGADPIEHAVAQLKSGALRMACEDPDDPKNYPRNLFVWRSNLFGASGKGHEYFLKHLLGAENGVLNLDLEARGASSMPEEVVWRHCPDEGEGKLDLLVTIDFRMNTTTLFSDIVLPTASWYEKNDLNTTDMHPFIHPLGAAVDPVWESRTDWSIFKGIAESFSRQAEGVLGVEKDLVLTPLLHDTPTELGQHGGVRDWRKGECEPIPGKTMPSMTVVERDYPSTYRKFTSVGPLLEQLGIASKGIAWDTTEEIGALRALNRSVTAPGITHGRPRLETEVQAAEMILMLAPETNGAVAVKAWRALGEQTGREHTHLAVSREQEKIRFRDLIAQPRKIISSPTWSGIESEQVSYNAGWTNVHELIPWRTLTGRQHFYQDHPWMHAFGEGFCTYKPPIDTKSIGSIIDEKPNGNPQIVLNFLTPHQKWGIHSTFAENLIMLTLSRGGPALWMNEDDARRVGIEDNDWIEGYNRNGSLCARVIVSQRIPRGTVFMYHALERTANVPGSEITNRRGGIHNSLTRVILKPTHMIGGYAQLSYGFNYYGTVGSNRDEFLIVRKMKQVDWRDRTLAEKREYMDLEEEEAETK